MMAGQTHHFQLRIISQATTTKASRSLTWTRTLFFTLLRFRQARVIIKILESTHYFWAKNAATVWQIDISAKRTVYSHVDAFSIAFKISVSVTLCGGWCVCVYNKTTMTTAATTRPKQILKILFLVNRRSFSQYCRHPFNAAACTLPVVRHGDTQEKNHLN